VIPPAGGLDPMQEADLDAVVELERRIFRHPWNRRAFERELGGRPLSRSWVVRDPEAGIVAYACAWHVAGELLINNIAVADSHRRRGLGRALLVRLLDDAREAGLEQAVLEVRVTNAPALALYAAHGFRSIGRRRRYYSDGEDAWVLAVPLSGSSGGSGPHGADGAS
jgi:[ribosomal protein S18]-alanine N-acetyltransferase